MASGWRDMACREVRPNPHSQSAELRKDASTECCSLEFAGRRSLKGLSEGAMYGNPQRLDMSNVTDLRREGGRWLKERREQAGLYQRQLAERVGVDYYTFISQLETGQGRIPPDRYREWARALEMNAREFVREILRFYDPITYDLLFPAETKPEQAVKHP